ncbi:methyltransferase domain-containing protein [bacterium]|nr:methyltransferase domain-containing protein [bacterium]
MSRIPGGSWLVAWTDPLHIARRILWNTIKEHADYARGWVLDLGCGAQPYRSLFQHVDRYVSFDVSQGPQIDVRGTALALPFVDSAFHTVLCSEVLEHVPEPSRLLVEVERVLKPGGILILTTPQTWGLHLEPFDFYRYTKHGLRYLAEKSKLNVIELIPTCGMWATLTQRLSDTVIFNYAEGRNRWIVEGLSLLLAPVNLIGYGLDKLFGKRGDTLDHLMIAQKPQ